MSKFIKSDEDIVIVGACRTPLTKANRGKLKDVTQDVLLYSAINGTLSKSKVLPSQIDEVVLGHVLSPMNGSVGARMAALRAEIPLNVPVMTINRQCASGLESVGIIADKLRLNKIKIGLAGGFETMSHDKFPSEFQVTQHCDDNEYALQCLLPMGITSENLAERFKITRQESDLYAAESQRRSMQAVKQNLFMNEIVSVVVENESICADDGIRETFVEKLKSLKPVFKENGVSTAGNCSQLTDGAAAVILMKRETAIKQGLSVKGVFIDYVVTGVEPGVMGIGPIYSTRLLLEKHGLGVEDIAYFEINEAFAPQAVHCIKSLGIDSRRVNLYGGAIALGHPLGCSGARLVCTLLNVMENEKMHGYGVVSLCVGSGHGISALFWKE